MSAKKKERFPPRYTHAQQSKIVFTAVYSAPYSSLCDIKTRQKKNSSIIMYQSLVFLQYRVQVVPGILNAKKTKKITLTIITKKKQKTKKIRGHESCHSFAVAVCATYRTEQGSRSAKKKHGFPSTPSPTPDTALPLINNAVVW